MDKIIINDVKAYGLTPTNLNGREANFYLDKEKKYLYKLYKPLPFRRSEVIYITNMREKKIEILSSKSEFADAMVLPLNMVYDQDGLFKGYNMKYYADAIDLEKYFVNKDKQSLEMYYYCMEISKYFKFFHKNNIYLPDFNFRNVLLNQGELIFCDADSYKIGDIPATMNSSFMISHYHTKGQKIIENANFDKELLIGLMLNILYNFNISMLHEKDFNRKLKLIQRKYEFTEEELKQFSMLKKIDGYYKYPHEFMQPVKRKIKKSFWF